MSVACVSAYFSVVSPLITHREFSRRHSQLNSVLHDAFGLAVWALLALKYCLTHTLYLARMRFRCHLETLLKLNVYDVVVGIDLKRLRNYIRFLPRSPIHSFLTFSPFYAIFISSVRAYMHVCAYTAQI
jgi:hypothetical protein